MEDPSSESSIRREYIQDLSLVGAFIALHQSIQTFVATEAVEVLRGALHMGTLVLQALLLATRTSLRGEKRHCLQMYMLNTSIQSRSFTIRRPLSNFASSSCRTGESLSGAILDVMTKRAPVARVGNMAGKTAAL